MSRRVAEADRIDCLTSPDQLSIKAFLYGCNKGEVLGERVFMAMYFGLRWKIKNREEKKLFFKEIIVRSKPKRFEYYNKNTYN